VKAVGEVSYTELPRWLHGMDVCLIPFLVNELTLATNPVKVYEYLAAGKPVVATELPELGEPELAPFVRRAADHAGFVRQVREALEKSTDSAAREPRRRFAKAESWAARAAAFHAALDGIEDPLVSLVVITWNNVELSRRCIQSILEEDDWTNLEIVIVDNDSKDGTPAWLDELEESSSCVRVLRNAQNRGFAAACNQGLKLARGEYLVILNNDVVVTPGWIRTLVRHLRRDPDVGLIGPITNNIGNEARVKTEYQDLDAMVREAQGLVAGRAGSVFEISVLAFYCVMIPRAVWQEIGGLDESYGTGFFEDDDYCQRVRQTGRSILCAEDVFVHHELSAAFDLVDQESRRVLFEGNKAYYESKWGSWIPHRYQGGGGE
jgi:GT2 family glycosyltransferase